MPTKLRMETTILPGHRLEISVPELPEGVKVEVIVVLPEKPQPQFGSALEFLESLPAGPRAFKTWDEWGRLLLRRTARFPGQLIDRRKNCLGWK